MQKSNTNKKKAKGKKKPDKAGDERAAPERQTEALHQQVCPPLTPTLAAARAPYCGAPLLAVC